MKYFSIFRVNPKPPTRDCPTNAYIISMKSVEEKDIPWIMIIFFSPMYSIMKPIKLNRVPLFVVLILLIQNHYDGAGVCCLRRSIWVALLNIEQRRTSLVKSVQYHIILRKFCFKSDKSKIDPKLISKQS